MVCSTWRVSGSAASTTVSRLQSLQKSTRSCKQICDAKKEAASKSIRQGKHCKKNLWLYLNDPQCSNANCGDKTVINGLRWYASDRYRPLITIGGVGVDFSLTAMTVVKSTALKVYLQVSYDTFRSKMTFESKKLAQVSMPLPIATSERSSPKVYTHHSCKSTCTDNNKQTSISNIHLYGIWLSKVQCSWLLGNFGLLQISTLKYSLWVLYHAPDFLFMSSGIIPRLTD